MNTSPDNNVETVRQKLLDRSVVGLNKYGVTTERTDLDNKQWLTHLQEELLDAAVYVQASMSTTKLYLVDIQLKEKDYGFNESFVVSAKSEDEAEFLVTSYLEKTAFSYLTVNPINTTIIGDASTFIEPNVIICATLNIEQT